MTLKEAREAIEAILASIPDQNLPKFDRVEQRDGNVIVWYGSTGRHLGSAKRDGEREPLIYRRQGSWDAIEAEMAHRADRLFLDNGDVLKGVKTKVAKRAVRA